MKKSIESSLANAGRAAHPHVLYRHPFEDYRLALVPESAARREEVERFIAHAYGEAFGARLRRFYASIVVLEDGRERILGAVGARPAARRNLFCEHYLPGRVESMIAEQAGPVCRDQIVEIGNLAIGRAGVTHVFFTLLGQWLSDFDAQWLVFALTAPLRHMLHRAHVPVLDLAPAKPEHAPDDGNEWGCYYESQPRVCAVPTVAGLNCFQAFFRHRNGGTAQHRCVTA